jgi:hypothetical protein
MSEEIHRDLGKHDAQIEALKLQVNRMYEDMQQIMSQLTVIQQTLSEAKGGWKTLMWVGGLSAAVGAVLVKALTWLQIFPK